MRNMIRTILLILSLAGVTFSTGCSSVTTTTTTTNSLTTGTQATPTSIQTSIIAAVSPSQIMLVSQGASHGMNAPINEAITQDIAILVNNLDAPLSAAEVSKYQDP